MENIILWNQEKKISKGHKGKTRKFTEKHKRNLRLARIRYKEKQIGQIVPNYNLKSQEYFKKFDEEHNTSGRYALNGGEFQIKDLGYFPDYINFDLKLIIEWDEKHHYDCDGNLKKKDVQRQREIEKLFPDFEFIRIKDF